MTRGVTEAFISVFICVGGVHAQQTPESTIPLSLTPTASPSASAVPTPSVGATPLQTAPTPAPRSVRISFLPPPLEGTISLGIYDQWGGLVRVLHQEAELDEFTVGEDALLTRWDGRNDDGEDLPGGKYHARGYLVGHLKVEDLGKAPSPPADFTAASAVQIRLMPNPLAKDERPVISLSVGFDDENSYLRTEDGLPLFTISKEPRVTRAAITKNTDKSIDVWQDDGAAVKQVRVSNVDKMMAFDCGDFELK
jgi:hypothetical protein